MKAAAIAYLATGGEGRSTRTKKSDQMAQVTICVQTNTCYNIRIGEYGEWLGLGSWCCATACRTLTCRVAEEDYPVRSSILGGVGLVLVGGSLLAVALTGCGSGTAGTENAQASQSKGRLTGASDVVEGSGKGMAAIKQAAEAGKYIFMFFSKTDDDQTLAMRKVFDKAMERVADRAQWIAVDMTDSSEKAIVAKFELSRAPMPLVLAMAPNGAITGGFPTKFEEQQLVNAFATPVTEKVMKNLQDGKLVLVCVQNGKTKSNDAAMQGVHEFKSDCPLCRSNGDRDVGPDGFSGSLLLSRPED